ncbi:hypothetical protein KDX28_01025 [Burkholderia vietnamiensis]|nr:hypothetical protein [Burkholderia vietnamiensis]
MMEGLHDWYIDGVEVEGSNLRLSIHFQQQRKVLFFSGVSRCLLNNFLIQNVICELNILSASENPERYGVALGTLNEAYPWPPSEEKKIAMISPSVGAEMIVEFTDASLKPDGYKNER